MAEFGYHCYAPDWLGYGFSERPQPVYDFSYTGICFSSLHCIVVLSTVGKNSEVYS